MPQMIYDVEEMINRASSIGQNASEILESQNKVTGIFQNMGRDFSGKIPSLMTEKMIAMEGSYHSMNELLNGYKTFIEDAARGIEQTDQEAARVIERAMMGGI